MIDFVFSEVLVVDEEIPPPIEIPSKLIPMFTSTDVVSDTEVEPPSVTDVAVVPPAQLSWGLPRFLNIILSGLLTILVKVHLSAR